MVVTPTELIMGRTSLRDCCQKPKCFPHHDAWVSTRKMREIWSRREGFRNGILCPPPTPPCLFYLPKNLTIPSPTLIDNKRPMVSTKLPVGYWCCLENVAVKCEMGAVSFLLFNAHSRLCFQNARRIWIHPVTCDVHLFVHSARRQMHI